MQNCKCSLRGFWQSLSASYDVIQPVVTSSSRPIVVLEVDVSEGDSPPCQNNILLSGLIWLNDASSADYELVVSLSENRSE